MTPRDILAGFALALVYGTLCLLALAYDPARGCTTDSDCHCIDDCLDPLSEDDAHTAVSQGRH